MGSVRVIAGTMTVIYGRFPPINFPKSTKTQCNKQIMRQRSGAKTIKKNTNSTQNKSQTHRAKQYEVTSFLSTDCELTTETCSKNVYSLGPWCFDTHFLAFTLETALYVVHLYISSV